MSTEEKRVTNVVGVRFSPTGRVHYFDPGDKDLIDGDRVVVETEGGPQKGTVIIAPRQVLYSEMRGPLAPVLRKLEADKEPKGPSS